MVICGFHSCVRFTSYRLVGLLINFRKVHAHINANMTLTHTHICNIYLYM
jgi:hypothetical protein